MKTYLNFSRYFFLFFILALFNSCYKQENNLVAPIEATEWQVSSPESQNINSALLDELSSHISTGDYGEIKSLIITRNNFLVYEKYYRGASRDRLHADYSVTKSVTSALFGMAIGQGASINLQDKLLSYFPEYNNIANLDSLKQIITIKDVLTMTAGFSWNELSLSYSDPNNDFQKLYASSDRIKYVFDKPMQDVPGSKFTYNTGLTLLLASILKRQLHESVQQFAAENLFRPMGIISWGWDTTPDSITNTGNGLSLRPRDMALLGQLYLNKGVWNGKQIIPASWIDESTSPSYTGSSFDYGYQWWMFSLNNLVVSSLKDKKIFFADGFGDQYIFVIPSIQMVVVLTAENGENSYPTYDILQNYILPAVQDK